MYQGGQGDFNLKEIPTHDVISFARTFVRKRHGKEFMKTHLIEPRRYTERTHMAAQHVTELKGRPT